MKLVSRARYVCRRLFRDSLEQFLAVNFDGKRKRRRIIILNSTWIDIHATFPRCCNNIFIKLTRAHIHLSSDKIHVIVQRRSVEKSQGNVCSTIGKFVENFYLRIKWHERRKWVKVIIFSENLHESKILWKFHRKVFTYFLDVGISFENSLEIRSLNSRERESNVEKVKGIAH